MIINLKIPDSLYEAYLLKYGSPGHYGRMKTAIEAYKDVSTGDRAILVMGDDRKALEALLETPIGTSTDLVRLVTNMCSAKIQGIEVNFTVDQLQQIKAQAEFHGKTSEQFISEMVTEIIARFCDEY